MVSSRGTRQMPLRWSRRGLETRCGAKELAGIGLQDCAPHSYGREAWPRVKSVRLELGWHDSWVQRAGLDHWAWSAGACCCKNLISGLGLMGCGDMVARRFSYNCRVVAAEIQFRVLGCVRMSAWAGALMRRHGLGRMAMTLALSGSGSGASEPGLDGEGGGCRCIAAGLLRGFGWKV